MIVKRNPTDPDACSNCGEKIGRLEIPHLWNGHVVCAACASKLDGTQGPRTPVLNRGEIVCPNPNCNYAGTPIKKSRGVVAFVVGMFVLLVAISLAIGRDEYHEQYGELLFAFSIAFLIVGLLVAFVAGKIKKCPQCGLQIRDDGG